jgi:PAS domain S-box-containing protein
MSKLALSWQNTAVIESVFDQFSDALVLYDIEYRITGVNRSAERLFDMSSGEMLGKPCREVFQCTECERRGVPAGLDQTRAAVSGMFRLHIRNGIERLVAMVTRQVLDDGRLVGIAATIREITEREVAPTRELIAESAIMMEILGFVRRVAASEAATILLDGESGTGKDLIAKSLHYQSPRKAEPFITLNCAAIPGSLLESELFGYEKGAFTDAHGQKRGIFELADKGTLFLDEIGEIPLVLQAKLLRVLEDQSFRRLGGLTDVQLDLRVVAATNKNLREAVKQGAFRQDLYYRLNVIQITIPPLRKRIDDIRPLAKFFIEHYNHKFNRTILGLSDLAMNSLVSYDWPGNVRELRNAIERGMILEETSVISSSSLPEVISGSDGSGAKSGNPWTMLQDRERRLVARALERTSGNQTQAARLLRITRDKLRYKQKRLGLL